MITSAEHAAYFLLPISLVLAALVLCAGEFRVTRRLTGAPEPEPEVEDQVLDTRPALNLALAAADMHADVVAQAAVAVDAAAANEAGGR